MDGAGSRGNHSADPAQEREPMLQIIKGKFFGTRQREKWDGYGVAYSNFEYHQSMQLSVGTLEPALPTGAIASYVLRYQGELERAGRGLQVVRIGDAEITEQLLLLGMFGLRAYFSADQAEVGLHCRERLRDGHDNVLPQAFVPRYFDLKVQGTSSDAQYLNDFSNHMIGLSRATFELVMRYMSNFRQALEAVSESVDLAYSMLVFSLEALSQRHQYVPVWADYDEGIRRKLDTILNEVDGTKADGVRAILVSSSHLKLTQRFITFILEHLPESFFIEGATMPDALRPSETKRVLRNAYQMRSKYAHELQQIQAHLRNPLVAGHEVFHWEGEPFLTFRGLIRIAECVLHEYVRRQPQVQHEPFDWRSALPGVQQYELDPRYWAASVAGLRPLDMPNRLSAFLGQLTQYLMGEPRISNYGDVLDWIEVHFQSGEPHEKRAMYALYRLFHGLSHKQNAIPRRESFLAANTAILTFPSIEGLIVTLVEDDEMAYSVSDAVEAYRRFDESRFHKVSVKVPRSIEVGIILMIANSMLASGQAEEATKWMKKARLESSGLAKWQAAILGVEGTGRTIDINSLLTAQDRHQRIELRLRCDNTAFGETVCVSGDAPWLGSWDARRAIPLDASAWPVWQVDLRVETGRSFRYRYLIRKADGGAIWEGGPDRELLVGDGSAAVEDNWRE